MLIGGGFVLFLFERHLVDAIMQRKGLTDGTRFWLEAAMKLICWAYVIAMCITVNWGIWIAYSFRTMPDAPILMALDWIVALYIFAFVTVWIKIWLVPIKEIVMSVRESKRQHKFDKLDLCVFFIGGLIGMVIETYFWVMCVGILWETMLPLELFGIIQFLLLRQWVRAIGDLAESGKSGGAWESIGFGLISTVPILVGAIVRWWFVPLVMFFAGVWVFAILASLWLQRCICSELRSIEEFKVDLTKKRPVECVPEEVTKFSNTQV